MIPNQCHLAHWSNQQKLIKLICNFTGAAIVRLKGGILQKQEYVCLEPPYYFTNVANRIKNSYCNKFVTTLSGRITCTEGKEAAYYHYRCSAVCGLCVYVSVRHDLCQKWLNQSRWCLGVRTRDGRRNHVGAQIPQGKGQFWGALP